MPLLVRDIIDSARLRHWSFADLALGDGAALLFLNARQKTHLANFGVDIEGLAGTTMRYNLTTLSGALVAMSGGVPVYGTTFQDGYVVHLTSDVPPVPYVDLTEAPVATDPFGIHGGTPGFPLPVDFTRLINVALEYGSTGQIIPCDVIKERERHDWAPGPNPAAFVSGNRLVPLLPLASGNSNNRWNAVAAIQISYVPAPNLSTLDDALLVPSTISEAMVADLALMFAQQSQKCPTADKAAIERESRACAAAVSAASSDMLDSVEMNSVHFRG